MKKHTLTNTRSKNLFRIGMAYVVFGLLLFTACSKEEELPQIIIPTRVSFTQQSIVIAKDKMDATTIAFTLARPLEKSGTIVIQQVTDGTTATNAQFTTNPAFTDDKLTIELPQGATTASFNLTSKHNFDDNKTIAFKIIAATGGAVLEDGGTRTATVVNMRGNLWIEPAITTSLATLPDFGNVTVNTNSTAKTYTLAGLNLATPVTITASANFKVSLNNVDFTASVSPTVNNTSATIYVKFNPTSTINQALTGTITHSATGLANVVVNVSGAEIGNIVYVPETPVLNENFSYGNTTDFLARLTTDWNPYSGAGSIPVTYVPQGLAFTRYAGSGIGGAVTIEHGEFSREDVSRTFAQKTTGVIYTAALVNLTKAGDGDFFLSTRDAGGSFFNRLYVKDAGGNNLTLGLGKNATVQYATTNHKYNTTYLVVIKYDFATKISSMYVFDGTFPDAEPTIPLAVSLATGTSPANLNDIVIRQSDGVLSSTIDGIRIATTWRGVLGY